MITGRCLNSWGGHGLASWPQGKGGVPGQRKMFLWTIFFLREIEIYASRCAVRTWRGRNFYALKQLHRDSRNDIPWSISTVFIMRPWKTLKKASSFWKKQPVYIQPSYTDELKCKRFNSCKLRNVEIRFPVYKNLSNNRGSLAASSWGQSRSLDCLDCFAGLLVWLQGQSHCFLWWIKPAEPARAVMAQ